MKYGASALLVLVLAVSPALASKVYIDYDQEYDGDSIETFAWSDTPETSLEEVDGLMHSRIIEAIEYYLSQSGLVEVEENPDVFVTYHADSRQELQLNTNNWGYGYPSGWYSYGNYGVHSSTTTATQYTKGTLVVDVWDAGSDTLVWRGTAGEIYVPKNPTKLVKKIDRALAKMAKQWQKIKARDEKRRQKEAAKSN